MIYLWLYLIVKILAQRRNGNTYTFRPNTVTDYPYGNEGVDPYRTQKCVKISSSMPICNRMEYKDMWLPNFMEQESLKEVADGLKAWENLVLRNCHHELPKFLCSLYTPVCLQNHNKDTPSDMLQTRIPPCKQLCVAVRDACLPTMKPYGYSWPETLNCTKFPDLDKTRLCVPPSTKMAQAPKEKQCTSYCLYTDQTKVEGGLLKEQFCRAHIVFVAKVKGFKTGKRYGNNVLVSFNNKSLQLYRGALTKSELQRDQLRLLDALDCYNQKKCESMKKSKRKLVLVMANQVETKSRRGRKNKRTWTITHLSKMPKKNKEKTVIKNKLTMDGCCNAGVNSCQN